MNVNNIFTKKLELTRNSFEYVNIIGRGGFGKVWKVTQKKTGKNYAMKEMSKAKIIDKKSINSIKNERNFLSYLNHPFLVNMYYAFQDHLNLYLIIDLFTGGDLRYQLCQNYFSEKETKFFIACIILSLEYIHTNKIMHRDLKPENLVLDSNGKVHLTDFGIAKKISLNISTAKDTSGTPGYMSPEVMCGLEHSMTVDFFALGVIGYECMHRYRPYQGNSRKEIKDNIMAKQVRINLNKIPRNWSQSSADFINKCIIRKPMKRLGFNGIKELKEHLWFKDFNWGELYMGKMKAPFIPKNTDNYDYKYCNAIEKIGINTQERYNRIFNGEEFINGFGDYCYFDRNLKGKNNKDIEVKNPHIIYEIQYDIEMEINKKKHVNNNRNKILESLNISKTVNYYLSRNSKSKSKSKDKILTKTSEDKNKSLKREKSYTKWSYNHSRKKSKPKILFEDDVVKDKEKSVEKINQKKFVNNINVLIFNYQQSNNSNSTINNHTIGKINSTFHQRNFSSNSTNINSNK